MIMSQAPQDSERPMVQTRLASRRWLYLMPIMFITSSLTYQGRAN